MDAHFGVGCLDPLYGSLIGLCALQMLGGLRESGGHRVEREGCCDEHGDGFGDALCIHWDRLSTGFESRLEPQRGDCRYVAIAVRGEAD